MPFPAKLAVFVAIVGSVGRIAYQLVVWRREKRAIAELMREGEAPGASASKG